MATWNASANAQMAEIAKELTAQQNQDVHAAISRCADQHHDGNTELRIGGYLFQIVVRNDVIERVTFGRRTGAPREAYYPQEKASLGITYPPSLRLKQGELLRS